MIGLILILIVLFFAVFGDRVIPMDPNEVHIVDKYDSPNWVESTNPQYVMGTDNLGRDVLSRLIAGARVTMEIAFFGTLISVVIGVFLGVIAGYYGGWIDALIMRIAEVQMSFPFILLALFMAAVLGPGLRNIIIIAAVSSWVRYARVVRGDILSAKQMEYVDAERTLGAGNWRIMLRHILPNVINPIVVLATLEVGGIITMESGLSYLGVGLPIEIPTWGRMLADARAYIFTQPWPSILPGVCITVTVLGVNLFGDWIRDYLDPRQDI